MKPISQNALLFERFPPRLSSHVGTLHSSTWGYRKRNAHRVATPSLLDSLTTRPTSQNKVMEVATLSPSYHPATRVVSCDNRMRIAHYFSLMVSLLDWYDETKC